MAKRKQRQAHIQIELERHDAESLAALARYYERSMGPARHVVRLTAGSEFRAKYRFMAAESRVLEQFAESVVADMAAAGEERREVTMSIPALVAFWGRIIASLASRRSRRKLSSQALADREALGSRLESAVRAAWGRNRPAVEDAISTRRPAEADAMRRSLGLRTSDVETSSLPSEG